MLILLFCGNFKVSSDPLRNWMHGVNENSGSDTEFYILQGGHAYLKSQGKVRKVLGYNYIDMNIV